MILHVSVFVCKYAAESLELRVVRYRYVIERYLAIFGDVSSTLVFLIFFEFCQILHVHFQIFSYIVCLTVISVICF